MHHGAHVHAPLNQGWQSTAGFLCLPLLFPFSILQHRSNNMSVKLISSDNEDFTVDKAVAERSVLIKNMLEGKWHETHSTGTLGIALIHH